MQFEQRRVGKRYEAIVEGLLEGDAGDVDLPLIVDWPNRPKQTVDHERGKPALTRWRVMARDVEAQRTRVELEPITGRSHQLRLHMASIGHPIVGDVLYDAAPAQRAPACAQPAVHPSGDGRGARVRVRDSVLGVGRACSPAPATNRSNVKHQRRAIRGLAGRCRSAGPPQVRPCRLGSRIHAADTHSDTAPPSTGSLGCW